MSFLGTTTLIEQPRQLNGKSSVRRWQRTPAVDDELDAEVQFGQRPRPLLNERTFTLILILFSLSVVVGKLFLNHDFFGFLDIDNKVNGSIHNYKDITDKAIIQPLNKYTWFIKAVVTGLATTGVTWFILYEDSHIPGVNPPSPFSPSKKRIYPQSSTLELNYFVGGLIGFLVFLYMCL